MPKALNNVKDDILTAARKMLTEAGYVNLNMRTIASHCGIATGTLYNYYKSKQEIVGEILKNEWTMMLRRIDQGTKNNIETIDKLEVIYTELGALMNDVHNIWIDNSSSHIDGGELAEIKCGKDALMESLSQKVLSLIRDDRQNKDFNFISDVICRLFTSYCYKQNIAFEKLKPIISSILA